MADGRGRQPEQKRGRQINLYSTDGKFNQRALATLRKSYVEK